MLKKQDGILIGVCLLAACVIFFLYRQMGQGSEKEVVIYIGEEECARYDLEEEVSLDLSGIGGGSNYLVIQGGKADVTQASCPDQICVKQAAVSEIGEAIVCLPNQVIVAIESAAE